ncbi:patatin-like phospholipase family protein [Urbifossiella limnaea]|uniref:Patatin-like phospholipase n=1 Tax=Urbifossiella limnaea TaxID=2528023 RepID=A0A517XXX0_9BACT|nr:patatin-like phospholipase family protein [Urbifossiella limnaea]QDU22345.1 Patatin-like phospholipase [Urbifossiella limnaea]
MAITTRGRRPRLPDLLAATLVVALAAALGCTPRSFTNPPTNLLDSSWYNRTPPPDPYPDPDSTLSDGLASVFGDGMLPMPTAGGPQNVLVISGGGKYGAYVAGILCGWTENGTRPTFDVCTGISSGALIASLAFLGPKYDARLAREFNNVGQRDILRFRPVRGLLFNRGLATSAPLRELVERNLDDEAFADMRAAHHAGRRLFVATVSLTTQRAVVWDVGAVATSGRPDARELVYKIMIAACSIPGVMPPVEFDIELNGQRYQELHVDAGNVIQAFVQTPRGLPPGSNVYIVASGKIYRDPLDENPRFLKVMAASVSNTMYALFRESAYKMYALCAVTGSNFHLNAVPTTLKIEPGSMTFKKEEMRLLFDVGRQSAVGGVPWRRTPPSSQPGETMVPRTGLEYTAEGCGPWQGRPVEPVPGP